MKDLEKIKEFFLKDRAMTAAYESVKEAKAVELNDKQKKYLKSILNNRYGKGAELGYIDNGIEEFIQRVKLDLSKDEFQDLLNQDILKIRTKPGKKPYKALFLSKDLAKMNLNEVESKEYFKPLARKDKNNPNFLYIDITYPTGTGFTTALGSKTMSGQEREAGAAKALAMGNNVAKKLQAKYNIEDINVSDLKNGKVEVFAVSDDFIKMASPSLDEAKTAIDMAKKQLDQLGAKYEMSGNKFKPFKVIYKPIGKSDDWYDKFDEIVYLFNLESAVKSSMNEASMLDNYEVDFFHTKANVYANIEIPSENPSFEDDIQIKGTGKTEEEAFEDLKRNYEKYKKTGISEAKEEDVVDTITMDVPLFIRMLEYSREDAAQDVDLHDVTEKAISLGKERGILQMDDYAEIVGAAEDAPKEEMNEVNLKASKLSSTEYQKAKKLKDFKASNWKWNADEDLYVKVTKKELAERINEAFDKINEELCPAGKAYIKRRQAAGEKSSAYLSGRAVKVCKGQMSGKAKKK